jgi:hypothetical protein
MSLSALDLADFESAASEIAESVEGAPEATATLVAAGLKELSESTLDAEEVHRRTPRFIEVLPTSFAVQRALATGARTSKQEIKSAIVAEVPRELRRLIYAKPEDVQSDDVADPAEEAMPTPPPAATELAVAPVDDWHTVLLLGDKQDVEGNARFLESRGFVAINVTSTERLDALRRESFCGVVVYKSWRAVLLPGGFAQFLAEQLDRANLVYYRIDTNELGMGDSVELQALRGSYDSYVKANVLITDGCTLADTDVLELESRSASVLIGEDSSHG